MSTHQEVRSFIELLRLTEDASYKLSGEQEHSLDQGIKQFLDHHQINTMELSNDAGIVAGPFQLELPDIVLETLLLAGEILRSSISGEHWISTAPAIAEWLNALHGSITHVSIQAGTLCVYRALLLRTQSLSVSKPVNNQSLEACFPCPTISTLRKACKYASSRGCSLNPHTDLQRLIDQMIHKQLIQVDSYGNFIVMKR